MIRSSTIRQKVYKYVHEQDVFVRTNLTGVSFDNEWLRIEPGGTITVKGSNKQGYAWDGCSPKFNFLHLIWGTPDGKPDYRTEKPMTYYASMIHDALYQYKGSIDISRSDADIIFREILRESSFMWWWVYGVAVRAGGGFYGTWKSRKSRVSKIVIEKYSWLLTPAEVAMRDLSTALQQKEQAKQ